MIWFGAVMAFLCSAWLTHRFLDPSSRFHVLDHPNERSLHSRPTPRGGGLAIVIGITLGAMLFVVWYPLSAAALWIGLAVLLVAAVSFIDDCHPLPPAIRLAVHIAAAALVIGSDFVQSAHDMPSVSAVLLTAVTVILVLFYIVWMINLYNFMDGMDGFAGGMAVFGFGTFVVMGWTAGHDAFLAVSLIITTASAGFLFFNFPPARIFMGDVGSSTLGLLAATLSLWGVRYGVFPFWIALLVFSPFIVDATATLFLRLLRGDKIWQAHKIHFYQQLVQAGWGHRKTVLIEYAIMAGCGITALVCVRASTTVQAVMLSCWTLFYLIFFRWISRYASRRRPNLRE